MFLAQPGGNDPKPDPKRAQPTRQGGQPGRARARWEADAALAGGSMIESKPFAVGDVVVVVGGWAPEPPRKVQRIMRRWLELGDGTKWTLSGNPYPRGEYDRTFLEHY